MKTPSKLKVTFAALASLAMPALAQIDSPPGFIDYQGRVLDGLGDPVAKETTENIEMYFRIWNHISDMQGANLVWGEKQIVTVADGNFSVRLGEGDLIASSAGDNVVVSGMDDPRPSLLDVFDNNTRFLGVSVAPNSLSKPTSEIQPRLAFLTTPFAVVAEKARVAEFGPSNGTFEAASIGVGTSAPGSLFEVSGVTELSPTMGSGLISAGAFGSNHIALDADDIQSYSDGATPSVLKLNQHGGDIRLGGNVYISQGNLGIGISNPVVPLDVSATANAARFRVLDNPVIGNEQLIASMTGFFNSGAQLRFEGGAGVNIDVGQNGSGSFVVETNDIERFVVQSTGRVGLGTSSPSDTLTIGGTGNVRLNGGELHVRHDQADGIRWINSTGTIYARMFRQGSNNRLQVWNGLGGTLTGVYLQAGNQFWSAFSDERLKSDVEPVTGILDKIEDIRIVGYNAAGLRADPETGKLSVDHNRPPRKMNDGPVIKHEIGTIAQDWLEHFPELVTEPSSEDDHYGMAYERVGIVALGAAKELHRLVKANEEKIKVRDEKIAELEARLAKLEALMRAAQ